MPVIPSNLKNRNAVANRTPKSGFDTKNTPMDARILATCDKQKYPTQLVTAAFSTQAFVKPSPAMLAPTPWMSSQKIHVFGFWKITTYAFYEKIMVHWKMASFTGFAFQFNLPVFWPG